MTTTDAAMATSQISQVDQLLMHWGFPELIPKFRDEEIDLDALLDCKIDENMIAKAGPRTKFLRLRDAWKQSLSQHNFPPTYLNLDTSEIVLRTHENLAQNPPLFGTEKLLHFTNETQFVEDILRMTAATENQNAQIAPDETTLTKPAGQGSEVAASLTSDAPEVAAPLTSEAPELPAQPAHEVQIGARSLVPSLTVENKKKWNRNCKNPVSQYLQKNVKVTAILAKYDAGTIDSDDRQKLSDVIIVGEMNGDPEAIIEPRRFASLATEIHELLPNEDPYVYYIPRRVNRGVAVAPKGKLYNKYNQICKKLRDAGLRKNKRVESREDETEKATANDDLVWLSTHSEPWATVIEKWTATSEFRLSDLRKSVEKENKPPKKKARTEVPRDSICDYMQKYSALRQAEGYELLELDFALLFPECELKLTSQWESFATRVRALSGECNALSEVSVFHAFARLFEPAYLKTAGRMKQRSTKIEIVEGFLLHIKVIDDLNPTVDRLREQARKLKRPFQPIPVVIGPTESDISSSYVVIDAVLYRVESPQRAVDVAFKCYHALHAQYPVQSEGPWLLLQKAVYGIQTQWDNIIPRVQEILQVFDL